MLSLKFLQGILKIFSLCFPAQPPAEKSAVLIEKDTYLVPEDVSKCCGSGIGIQKVQTNQDTLFDGGDRDDFAPGIGACDNLSD
jgi:hypothetical protein